MNKPTNLNQIQKKKKTIIGIAIGVVVVFLVILGLVFFPSQKRREKWKEERVLTSRFRQVNIAYIDWKDFIKDEMTTEEKIRGWFKWREKIFAEWYQKEDFFSEFPTSGKKLCAKLNYLAGDYVDQIFFLASFPRKNDGSLDWINYWKKEKTEKRGDPFPFSYEICQEIKNLITGKINPELEKNLLKMCDASYSLTEFNFFFKEYLKFLVIASILVPRWETLRRIWGEDFSWEAKNKEFYFRGRETKNKKFFPIVSFELKD